MQLFDFESNESEVFANPKLSPYFYPSKWEGFHSLSGHIWIATSGTTREAGGQIKWVALSKQAFLASAQAVNSHLQSSSSDRWLNALPLFHVGGLSIYARAFLSGASVAQVKFEKWSPENYITALIDSKATLTSLVPTQLFDLLTYEAPPSLRAVIIGGGAVSEELYAQALTQKWPILPSFGMTECCSQIATAQSGDARLKILSHVKCSGSMEGLLQIQSPALLTGYLYHGGDQFRWEDPKKEGVFTTEDLVEIKEGILTFLGRKGDMIKIGGENVSLFQLEVFFNKIKPASIEAILRPKTDERLGKIIQLVTLEIHKGEVDELVQAFNERVMPYEKIRYIHYVATIPRSDLGKVLY